MCNILMWNMPPSERKSTAELINASAISNVTVWKSYEGKFNQGAACVHCITAWQWMTITLQDMEQPAKKKKKNIKPLYFIRSLSIHHDDLLHCARFWDIICWDVCLLSSMMELNGTRWKLCLVHQTSVCWALWALSAKRYQEAEVSA